MVHLMLRMAFHKCSISQLKPGFCVISEMICSFVSDKIILISFENMAHLLYWTWFCTSSDKVSTTFITSVADWGDFLSIHRNAVEEFGKKIQIQTENTKFVAKQAYDLPEFHFRPREAKRFPFFSSNFLLFTKSINLPGYLSRRNKTKEVSNPLKTSAKGRGLCRIGTPRYIKQWKWQVYEKDEK